MSGRFLDALQGPHDGEDVRRGAPGGAGDRARGPGVPAAHMSVLRVAFLSSFMLELISAVSIAIVAVVSGLRLLGGHHELRPGLFHPPHRPRVFSHPADTRAPSTTRAWRRRAPPNRSGRCSIPRSRRRRSRGPSTRPSCARLRSISMESAFSYPGRRVLDQASFHAGAGEHVALMGESGAGKSHDSHAPAFASPRPTRAASRSTALPLVAFRNRAVEAHPGLAAAEAYPLSWFGRGEHQGGPSGCQGGGSPPRPPCARTWRSFSPVWLASIRASVRRGRGVGRAGATRRPCAAVPPLSRGLVLLDEPTAHLDEESAAPSWSRASAGSSRVVRPSSSPTSPEGREVRRPGARAEGRKVGCARMKPWAATAEAPPSLLAHGVLRASSFRSSRSWRTWCLLALSSWFIASMAIAGASERGDGLHAPRGGHSRLWPWLARGAATRSDL